MWWQGRSQGWDLPTNIKTKRFMVQYGESPSRKANIIGAACCEIFRIYFLDGMRGERRTIDASRPMTMMKYPETRFITKPVRMFTTIPEIATGMKRTAVCIGVNNSTC